MSGMGERSGSDAQIAASDQEINDLMTLAYEQAMDKAAAKLACYREALERIAEWSGPATVDDDGRLEWPQKLAREALEKARSLPDD